MPCDRWSSMLYLTSFGWLHPACEMLCNEVVICTVGPYLMAPKARVSVPQADDRTRKRHWIRRQTPLTKSFSSASANDSRELAVHRNMQLLCPVSDDAGLPGLPACTTALASDGTGGGLVVGETPALSTATMDSFPELSVELALPILP